MQIQCQRECIIPDCSESNWSTVNKFENFITEMIEEFFLDLLLIYCEKQCCLCKEWVHTFEGDFFHLYAKGKDFFVV